MVGELGSGLVIRGELDTTLVWARLGLSAELLLVPA